MPSCREQTQPLPIDSALKERDKLLYAICAQSTDGIHVVDIETSKTIMANIALCQMLGYEPDEMMKLGMANRHTKLQPLLDEFVKDLAEMTACESVGLLLIDPSLPFCTPGRSFFIGAVRAMLESYSGDGHEYIKEINIMYGLESMAVVPVKIATRIIGIVYLADRRRDMVSREMVEIKLGEDDEILAKGPVVYGGGKKFVTALVTLAEQAVEEAKE